ncbi:hypothetical protein V5O48_000344 [Marasmius crinis-equi]|uniref:Uncharacterized protein n=1 Tax=Marasmius crinis-equi TaxID=585013 RepID=A0ABR3G1C4_9AGAR
MPLTEKLPGCRELLSLCDNFPRPALVPTDMSPIKLPPPSLEDGRRIRSTRLTLKPYPSTPGTRVSGATKARKRKDTFDREEQRKEKLENDPWSDKSRLTPKSVFCLGCHRHIRLDRRNDYYPGLWLKHRGLCHGIVKARKEAAAERQIVKREEEKMYYSRPPIDDDEAAEILAGMMIKSRCFSDSDTASTYSSS